MLGWPALARIERSDVAMLVFTEEVDDGPPSVLAVPIDGYGTPQGSLAEVSRGSGGTLVSTTLGEAEPGFTLSFQGYGSLDGRLVAARFSATGEITGTAPTGWRTSMMRPALLLTRELALNGWNALDGRRTEALLQNMTTRAVRDLDLPGVDPVAAPGGAPGEALVAVHDGTMVTVSRYDSDGSLLGSVHPRVGVDLGELPFGVGGAHVVAGAPDAVAAFGGVIRALEHMFVYGELGDHRVTWQQVNDFAFDIDAAYDEATGLLGIVDGRTHDEGIDRRPTPHVFFHALDRAGLTVELNVSGPLFDADPTELRPAVMSTGDPSTPFLIVWADRRGEDGLVMGALVGCD